MVDPSPEDWKRVQRYASWMHHVSVDESLTLTEDASHKFRQNSPAGGWFPALQSLSWCITTSNLPYADLFFSPHLMRIFISSPSPWMAHGVPRDILPAIASRIAALPTSALQCLRVGISWHHWMPWAYFKDSLSYVILQCGSSLTEFASPIPLSDAAINHLIRLPNLRTWHVECPPPNYSSSSLPPVFPPLTGFALGGGAACRWLSLFGRLEASVSLTRGMAPLSKTKESLQFLGVENTLNPVINVAFTSPIQTFHNLVSLRVEVYCHGKDGKGYCAFKLNNDDVAELAVALPQLEFLLLGHPCSENTCATTAACLLSISVYCPELEVLEIHFNTTNIADDLKNISVDPKFEEVRSLTRGRLSHLNVYRTPLTLDELGFETVAKGMVDIFPSMQLCGGRTGVWGWVNERIEQLANHPCASSLRVTSGFPFA